VKNVRQMRKKLLYRPLPLKLFTCPLLCKYMGSHNFYSFSKVKNFLSSDGNRWKLVVIVFVLMGMAVGVEGATPAGMWNGNTGVFTEKYLNATLGYYMGTTNVTPYILNADPAGDANFSSLEADDLYVRGSYNVTQLAMYPQQPASYIIWTDGSTYYAKNGTTGAIDYSGADASTVIQAAVDAIPVKQYVDTLVTGGGSIFIKAGLYEITQTIVINDRPLRLYGDNRCPQTHLYLAAGANCRMFEIIGESQWCYLKDLYLNGKKNTQTGGDYLLYINAGYPILENIYVMYAYETGIYINSQDFHCLNVYAEFCGKHGWYVHCSQNGQLIDCTAWDNDELGLYLIGRRGTINNFRSMMNGKEGIYCNDIHKFFFHGCYIQENGEGGLHFYNSDHISVTDCIIRDNGQTTDNTYDGIYFNGNNEDITIKGNKIYSTNDPANDQRDGIRVDGTTDNIQIALNHIRDNDGYGINIIGATNVDTLAKDNDLSGNGLGSIIDSGTGTKLATKTFQFTEPIVGTIATTSPTGVDVDTATEGALLWGQIPTEAQQIVRIKVWVVSTGTPINAGGQMHLATTLNAGATNLAYNTATKSWTLADFDGEEADYAANDIVHWLIEDSDVGNELKNLAPGDSFEFFALYNAGADPDGATDAIFRCIEIEYV